MNKLDFPEKELKAKPFYQYPYAFYNKYGYFKKPIIDPTFVNKHYGIKNQPIRILNVI